MRLKLTVPAIDLNQREVINFANTKKLEHFPRKILPLNPDQISSQLNLQ